jgi:hypothetical protein
MALLPITHLPTIEAIYKMYREKSSDFRRKHLGASVIGQTCERKIWYSFRWANDPGFEGRLLRLFESGYREEGRVIANLRNLGITVYDREPDSGEQINFKEDSTGGHFAGSVDGIAKGFEEAPSTWHILECKTSSKKLFDKLMKEGVEKAKYEHYCQMQIYMHWAELTRAYYIVCCKDDDRLYGERVYYDKDFAESLVAKARRIIFSEVPLEKISDNPDNFQCKWCEHSGTCHHGKLPLVSCRTCGFVTPLEDGTWTCGRDDSILGEAKQKAGCEGHIFIPQLVPLSAVDSDPEIGTITYAPSIVNGPGGILSKDLQAVIDGAKH